MKKTPHTNVDMSLFLRALRPAALAAVAVVALLASTNASATATATNTHTLYWINAEGAGSESNTVQTQPARTQQMVNYIKSINADVGAIAEFDPAARNEFLTDAGSQYRLVATSQNIQDNGVFFNTAVWTLFGHQTVTTYYWDGSKVPTIIPFLRDKTGYTIAVIPLHNPWGSQNSKWNTADQQILRNVAINLHNQHPDWHVVVAGDWNLTAPPIQFMTASGTNIKSPIAYYTTAHPSWIPVDQAFFTNNTTASGYLRTTTSATDHGAQYQINLVVQ